MQPHLSARFGIDLGKSTIHICRANPDAKPNRWLVTRIDMTDAAWHSQLAALIPSGSLIVCEPAGYALMAPVFRVITWANSQLYTLNNEVTRKVRAAVVSAQKTDDMDARALAWAASKIDTLEHVRGCYPFDQETEAAAFDLRLHLNSHFRLEKLSVRLQNQLDSLAYSMWPLLAQRRDTWLNAVRAGAITPAQVVHLAGLTNKEVDLNGYAMRYIRELAKQLPSINAPAATVQTVADLADQLFMVEPRLEASRATLEAAITAEPFADLTNLWRTIPSASDLAVAALHVITRGQIEHLTSEQFCTLCGVAPRTHASGSQETSRHAKAYYRPIKRELHLWALRLFAKDAPGQPHPRRQPIKEEAGRRSREACPHPPRHRHQPPALQVVNK